MVHTFRMLVTQCTLSHISQLDGPFRTCVHEPVAALWMELGSSDNFRELFHICRLDIDDVKALILDVEIPQVDTQVVATYKSLSIAIDGYTVDVVGVGVCIRSSRNGGHHGVVMRKAG